MDDNSHHNHEMPQPMDNQNNEHEEPKMSDHDHHNHHDHQMDHSKNNHQEHGADPMRGQQSPNHKDHESQMNHDLNPDNKHASKHHGHAGHDHHAMMVEDYKRSFFISLILILPILLLSPMIQMFMGAYLRFSNDSYILLMLSSILFIYGGKPFLVGAVSELKKKSPGMMTLISLAISVAYVYSTISVLIFSGVEFFWELATLIVIMLLGH